MYIYYLPFSITYCIITYFRKLSEMKRSTGINFAMVKKTIKMFMFRRFMGI